MIRTLALFFGLLSAGSFSQLPEFAQQYGQRLGGAVDELATIAADFDASADRAGLSREAALEQYSAEGNGFLIDRGRDMGRTLERYEKLSAQQRAFETADPIERSLTLVTSGDIELANETLAAYRPAVPVTAEGFLFAGAGFLAGFVALFALLKLVALPFRRRRPA